MGIWGLGGLTFGVLGGLGTGSMVWGLGLRVLGWGLKQFRFLGLVYRASGGFGFAVSG